MNRTQERLKKAYVAAGLSEEDADKKVAVFQNISSTPSTGSLCPVCRGPMEDVLLIGNRRARFCPKDRAVVPYPVNPSDDMQLYEEFMTNVSRPQLHTPSMFA